MEPKKDDCKTISEPSDRSIKNVSFLLNCPFYGAPFRRGAVQFFYYCIIFVRLVIVLI